MKYRSGHELYTSNELTVAATAASMYRLAADVARWPELLPHYRYVRILRDDGNTRLVEMGASRSSIPVRWTSIQTLDAPEMRIHYQHVHGVTRGMRVQWSIDPAAGSCHVSIEHWLVPSRLWLKNRFSQFIVGRLFVMQIADRTLHGLASRAEAQPEGESVP